LGGSEDERRFRELYDRTYNRLWSFVLRRVADNQSTDDIVSDTYLAVWRRIGDVPPEPPRADAWVFATARHVLANSYRSGRRRMRLVDRVRAQPVVAVLPPAGGDGGHIIEALARLSASQQEILVFAAWDDLTTDQIAVVLGCSKNAAAIRLSRAREALKDALAHVEKAFAEEEGGSS